MPKRYIAIQSMLALFLCFITGMSGLLSGCRSQSEAEAIVQKSIARHGGEQYKHALVNFDFRDRHYTARLDHGQFVYESQWTDSLGNQVHDSLSNENFSRTVNGQPLSLTEEDKGKYSNSLNSVIYFALLPHFLSDPAASKELIGTDTLKGQPYYKILVTFDEEGGGEDFEDEFVYWFHQQQYTMDFLAYRFHVEGGGTRFREAYNKRGINGLRFADYINYESTEEDFPLENYGQLFETGKVKELSRISLENLKVEELQP